jgi:uncharacterized membrane protein YkvA (DUF1232 family)
MVASMWSGLQGWARLIKRDTVAIYLAVRDRRTSWYAKAVGMIVVTYALSPIDLIPDFIPVLGYVDDLLVVPLGIWITVKLIPNSVMEDCRARAERIEARPVSWIAAAVIVGVWIAAAALIGWMIYDAARLE